MAFNTKEQEIINWGLQNGKSKEEVMGALTRYRIGTVNPTNKPTANKPALPEEKPPVESLASKAGSAIKNRFNTYKDEAVADLDQRAERVGENLKRADTSSLSGLATTAFQNFGEGVGFLANTIEKTAEFAIPGLKTALKGVNKGIQLIAETKPIQAIGEVIGGKKLVQELVTLYDNDPDFKATVNAVANTVRATGDVAVTLDVANYAAGKLKSLVATKKSVAELTKTEVSSSVDDWNTAIQEGHYRPTDIFKDPRAGVFQPQAYNHVVSDVSIKLSRRLGPEAAKEFQTVVKPTMTSAEIINTANKVVDNFGKSSGAIAGAEAGANVLAENAPKVAGAPKVPSVASGVARDIVPTLDRVASSEVIKALDLTQGDVRNLALSTGNDAGKFLADNNLIGKSVAETTKNLDNFFQKNYTEVRTEIGKVKTKYPTAEVPRYEQALKEIKKQVNDVVGLEKVNAEVDALLKKKIVKLEDIQRVKELMDEHLKLYKVTGDVKEGVAKQGLATVRSDIQKFIEKEVKDNTGADIGALNNNVSTARGLSDAVNTRSTRGLTRASISPADIVVFLAGGGAYGSPFSGLVAALAKRVYDSPTFKLRFSKWLDGISDARRATIQQELEQGILPKEISINQASGKITLSSDSGSSKPSSKSKRAPSAA